MGEAALDLTSQRQQLLDGIKAYFGVDLILFLDWETFYKSKANNGTKSFSITNRTYYDYIFDERFEHTGLGWALDMADWEYVHTEEDVQAAIDKWKFAQSQGLKIAVVAHNNQFDSSINMWRYGFKADFYFCTQLMRKLRAVHKSSSLKNTCIELFPNDESLRKGKELANYDGVRREDIPESDQNPNNPDTLAWYCVNDNHLLREIFFEEMAQGFPEGELECMHITLRGAVEPQFVVDRELLGEVVDDEAANKERKVKAAIEFCKSKHIADVSAATFSSNPKYKALLERFGVKVPTKLSKTTFQMTPALGKTDPEYIKMQIANPHLKPLYDARLVTKSTIAKARAEKMIYVADIFHEEGFTGADMPMFLQYYGAENTGRWSGKQKLNQQNLQRKSKHRLSLKAQDGFLIGVNDLSNIELRVNLWFCEQNDLLAEYDKDPEFDMYSALASTIYNMTVNKKDNPDERQIGKAGSLGLGYAMSWYGFQQYLAGGPLGMEPMFVSDAFAKNVKNSYDAKHPAIVSMWNEIENFVLPVLAEGGEYKFGRNQCVTAIKDKLILPSGRELQYPNCRREGVETQYGVRISYLCDSSRKDRWGKPLKRNLHKGLIIENIIQALARDILAWQMVKIEKELQANDLGWVIGSVHDEILAMLKENRVVEAFALMQTVMKQMPKWAYGIPLASEGGYAIDYSK